MVVCIGESQYVISKKALKPDVVIKLIGAKKEEDLVIQVSAWSEGNKPSATYRRIVSAARNVFQAKLLGK